MIRLSNIDQQVLARLDAEGTDHFELSLDRIPAYRGAQERISSKKMQDLFMQDDRMGGFFWIDTVEQMSDREKFAMIVSRYSNGLQSQGQEELRQQCIALGIPVGNLSTMRNAIAVKMADKAMGAELGYAKSSAAEDRKDALFQKKGE